LESTPLRKVPLRANLRVNDVLRITKVGVAVKGVARSEQLRPKLIAMVR
jgi:hypothetical protein